MSDPDYANTNDPVLRAKLAVTRARIDFAARRDETAVRAGGALARLGRRIALSPHLHETIGIPGATEVEGFRFDVMTDLAAYTGLPAARLDALVRRRSDSFRAEWFLAPRGLRLDDWFYLSSTTYLFGNAIHDPIPLVRILERHCGRSGRALDFGGGTGNLALALAAVGWSVDYLERSALQKDFVSFRIQRYDLDEQVRVLDDWRPIEANTYDLVSAVDVLEHVEDLEHVLVNRLLPSIRSGGALAESSPFVRNLSNPMHYEHSGLATLLEQHDFTCEADEPECRLWRLPA
jgi:SAM-dependent methyltransferase